MKFKDKCEDCGEWKVDCRGYDGKVMCPECIEKRKEEKRKVLYEDKLV